MKTDASQMCEADYDFSEVKPGNELEACFYYEYARESGAVMQEIDSIRKQTRQFKGRSGSHSYKFSSRVQGDMCVSALIALSYTSGFPKVAWHNLSEKDKQIMSKMAAVRPFEYRRSQIWHRPPLSFATNELGTTTLNNWKQKLIERLPAMAEAESVKLGFFALDLNYLQSELVEEFLIQVKILQGKPTVEFPPTVKKSARIKPPGRNSLRDKINALAAMRLRYRCKTFSEAKKRMLPLKDKPYGMFYERRDSFKRACDKASSFFQILFGRLDPSGRPIHFTEGWQEGD